SHDFERHETQLRGSKVAALLACCCWLSLERAAVAWLGRAVEAGRSEEILLGMGCGDGECLEATPTALLKDKLRPQKGLRYSIDKLYTTVYAEVWNHLVEGQVSEAHTLIKKFFIKRGKLYNENHIRVKGFIDPLLKSFCVAWRASIAQGEDKEFDAQEVNFISDLLIFCLESERYDELEILLQECCCPIKETRADSSDGKFRRLYSRYNGAQIQLAQLRAPGGDSFFGKIVEQQFKDSEIVAVLERKREANDWEILLAWGKQVWNKSAKSFANTSGPHKIWIFPEDIVECKVITENNWRYIARNSEDMYRFYHIKDSNSSEWMAIRHPCKDFEHHSSYFYPNEPRDPKKGGWPHSRYRVLENHELELQSLILKDKYNIEEALKFNIKVTVPFVPWEHFETTTAYRAGLSFREYMAIITDCIGENSDYSHNRRKLCRDTSQDIRPDWRIPTGPRSKKSRTGFFGRTPSGKALMLRDGPFACKNLVSTRWHDCKHFPLQPVKPSAMPNIVLPSGEIVSCLGSINGSWMYEEEAGLEWDGVQVFVVDVDIKDESNQTFNFVLSKASLRPEKVRALSSHEKRFFSAELSPHLFRIVPPIDYTRGSRWKRAERLETDTDLDDDTRRWEETNRRDKWSRGYERRLRACKEQPDNTGAIDALKAEYEKEQDRRRDWDAEDQRPRKLSSESVSKSSAGLPVAPSESNTWPKGLVSPSDSSIEIINSPPSPARRKSIAGLNISTKDSVASASSAGNFKKSRRDVLKSLFGKMGSS
ncbi:hypothetical protein V493_07966, partial [Pseudogymnoascus sp. VKM F-4281 (FW-2241)]